MKILKKALIAIAWIIGIPLGILIIINAFFYGGVLLKSSQVWNDGVMLLLPPDRAFLFVHGEWKECQENCSEAHFTYYGDTTVKTIDLLTELKGKGYNRIWGTWCYAGDHDYLVKYPNGTTEAWPEGVKRNTKPGKTIPIFLGYTIILT